MTISQTKKVVLSRLKNAKFQRERGSPGSRPALTIMDFARSHSLASHCAALFLDPDLGWATPSE